MKKTDKQITIWYKNGAEQKPIYKNKFTPYQFCCEYDNFYEIAMYDHYVRIDKTTGIVTSDRKDCKTFQIDTLKYQIDKYGTEVL